MQAMSIDGVITFSFLLGNSAKILLVLFPVY